MIIHPEIGNSGRLGNQLFQLAAMLAWAIENKSEAKLPANIYEQINSGQKCLLQYFQHGCATYSESEYNQLISSSDYTKIKYPENEDIEYPRENFIYTQAKNLIVNGWPESELFFKKYKQQIIQKLQFIPEYENFGREYIQKLKKQHETDKQIVSVHIRKGDLSNATSDYEWRILPQIIENMQKEFQGDHYIYLFFIGGSLTPNGTNQDDILWLKQNFQGKNNIICDLYDTLKDLAVMKYCDHHILSSRSTFSWWGAYLGKNPTRKIIVPTQTLGRVKVTADVFWTPEWTQIDISKMPLVSPVDHPFKINQNTDSIKNNQLSITSPTNVENWPTTSIVLVSIFSVCIFILTFILIWMLIKMKKSQQTTFKPNHILIFNKN